MGLLRNKGKADHQSPKALEANSSETHTSTVANPNPKLLVPGLVLRANHRRCFDSEASCANSTNPNNGDGAMELVDLLDKRVICMSTCFPKSPDLPVAPFSPRRIAASVKSILSVLVNVLV